MRDSHVILKIPRDALKTDQNDTRQHFPVVVAARIRGVFTSILAPFSIL